MLSPEAVKEFQNIFERTYGRKITTAEAIRRATNLIRLYRAVLCPILMKEVKKKHLQNKP